MSRAKASQISAICVILFSGLEIPYKLTAKELNEILKDDKVSKNILFAFVDSLNVLCFLPKHDERLIEDFNGLVTEYAC